jgi:hypothetical protein
MHSQTAITSIICCLLLGTSAAPLDRSFTKRSQTFGLGDVGGINRDESHNFSATTYGDALGQGIGNEFSPKSIVGGIGGAAAAAGLVRRSQVDNHGNIGAVNRDESFNFESEIFGDSVNDGIGNTINPSSFVDGVGGLLFKRSQVIEKHGNVEINRDESSNLSTQTYQDSVNNGFGNTVAGFSLVNDLGIGSRPLIRRSQVVSNTGDVRINRDESQNYSFETLGDSLNQGLGNEMSPLSFVNGLGSAPLIRRSQVVENTGDVRINRDESQNYSFETLGDSLNQGLGNSNSPVSVVNGVAGRLIKRSQVINKLGNTGINRDESLNSGSTSVGNSINNGWENRFEPTAVGFGDFGGFPRNRLFARSQSTSHGGVKSLVRDESFNYANTNFQDAVNSGIGNVLSSSSFVEDLGGPFLVRRSQVINKQGNTAINRDESQNQFDSAFGNSVNNGVDNRVASTAFVGPWGRFWRRSQVINDIGDKVINRDESQNQFSSAAGNSVNNGVNNEVAPGAFVGPWGGSWRGPWGRFWRRSQVINDIGDKFINHDESQNQANLAWSNSLNNGVNNEVAPATFAGPWGRFWRRSQVDSHGNIDRVLRDESFNLDTDNYGDALNSGLNNLVSSTSVADGFGGFGLFRRSQVVENSGNVSINRDESTNFASSTYGDSLNNGISNLVSPSSVVGGIAGAF